MNDPNSESVIGKSDLRVTLVQTNPLWEQPGRNRAELENLLIKNEVSTDIIILPEMFTTGFSMRAADLAEPPQGETLEWMRQMAAKLHCHMSGSWIVKEQARYFNRLHWVHPDGTFQYYDKRHLFSPVGEGLVYTAGKRNITVRVKGWNIRPLICYDLRFPVWSRNNNNEYDLLLYVANWPLARIAHWKLLLQARAVENQSYALGVNRVGSDANGYEFPGQSMVVGAMGQVLFQAGEEQMQETVRLSYAELKSYRERYPFWKDGDAFQLHQPGG